MNTEARKVASAAELVASAPDPHVDTVVVTTDLINVPTVSLSAGKTLRGEMAGITVSFAPGQDGVQLSTDNTIDNLTLQTSLDKCAVFNDTGVSSLGRLVLRNLRTAGVIQLLARDSVVSGHIEAENVDVVSADARAFAERPKGYGVEVIPGAFVLWNQQSDPGVVITADLTGICIGRAGGPVRGSGVFVSGAGDAGGRLSVHRLETGAVYSDGGIAKGTPDRITGGVFVVSGAFVDQVHNRGPVTTYGPNDMVLDNWGTVEHWLVDDKITSYGPSGIGFVNFGIIDRLEIHSTIETFGRGSRGFNVYSGTVKSTQFERIVTHADGAVGLQISQPVGDIVVRRGIETFGGTGDSLVKGVVVQLPAVALSIKPGGSARRIAVAGGVMTHGAGVTPLEIHGRIDSLEATGGVTATTGGFEKP
jgi:hypothetical protein